MAQLVRAPPCHGGGRRFESDLGRFNIKLKTFTLRGVLAQLGEHLPYKQRVTGSSPVGPTKIMDGFPSGQRGQTVNLLATLSVVRIHLHPFGESHGSIKLQCRGVEQLEARRAHNPEVVGSNPSPATTPR